MSLIRSHILVCTGTGCTSSESPKIIAEFEKQLAAQGMDKEAQVVRTGCFGLCALGPIVTIYPEGACYTHVTVDDVEEIVAEHIVKGRIVKRLLNRNEGGDGPATSLAETRFYKHQHRIALRNCGVINLEKWKDGAMYDRLGLENLYTTILDVQVPSLTVPVRPGRNLAVIIEVAAMNNRHKKMGYNAAVEFTKQINQHFDQAMSAQLNDN